MLIVIPWSVLWERNAFVEALPFLGDVTSNHFVRGAVSGLGVVNVWAGFVELAGVMLGRTSSPPSSPPTGAQPQQEPIH